MAAILVEVAIALKSRSNHVIDEHKQQERRKDYEHQRIDLVGQEESLAASQSMTNERKRFSIFTQSYAWIMCQMAFSITLYWLCCAIWLLSLLNQENHKSYSN